MTVAAAGVLLIRKLVCGPQRVPDRDGCAAAWWRLSRCADRCPSDGSGMSGVTR